MATHARYLSLSLVTAVLICITTVATNLVVDPFGAYKLVEWTGVNTSKPAMQRRVKLAKAYDLRHVTPQAIVLGTSRSHIGLRMTHPGWSVALPRRYNSAFDGATTREMYAYLRHAYALQPVRQVVLGLDTWQLGDGPATVRPDFDPSLLLTSGGYLDRVRLAANDIRLLANLATVQASFKTLAEQEAGPTWLAADGQRVGDVFFHEAEPSFVKAPGDYFRHVDQEEVGYKTEQAPPGRIKEPMGPGQAGSRPAQAETSFDYLARIVTFCREKHVDLRIFLTPAHAHQLEIARQVGEWPKIEKGKRELTSLLAADAAQHPNEEPFPLYDFSGYSSVTTETVPASGSRAEMTFYWDSSHFKELVGDWILDRLFDVHAAETEAPIDFGVKLTTGNVDAVNARMHANADAYRSAHADDVLFIKELVAKARSGQSLVAHSYNVDPQG